MGQNKEQKIEKFLNFCEWVRSLFISTMVSKPLIYEVNLYVKSCVKYTLCLRRELIWNLIVIILFEKVT